MWKYPWKYTEGWVICFGLFLTGAILQSTIGSVGTGFFRYPLNLAGGGIYLLLLVGIHVVSLYKKELRWFSGLEASITSLSSLLVLVLIMGLTRQASSADGDAGALGFHQMTSSWPFVLLFFYFLSVVGLVTLRRASLWMGKKVKASAGQAPKTVHGWKEAGFLLNHAGLFITLWAAILGSGDLSRLRMNAWVDTPEWRATDEQNRLVELPLAIELKSFRIETYPPKLMIIDNVTGKALPEERPVNWVAEEKTEGTLLDWDLRVTRSLPMAACVMSTDTANFVEFHSEGATTAVYVEATNRQNGSKKQGWISCGNYMFPYVTLELSATETLVMPDLEPRRFTSEVQIYTQDKQTHPAVIEVNKPFSLQGWKIYQLSYDEQMGRWSRTSVFELVKDPWLPVVYLGIGMMLAGAFCLFITAPGAVSQGGKHDSPEEE